ncbi:hypothetical protein, partial [Rhizobium oryzicola]
MQKQIFLGDARPCLCIAPEEQAKSKACAICMLVEILVTPLCPAGHLPHKGQCLQNQLSGFYLVPAGDLERRVADGLPEMPWTGSAQ